MKTETNNKLYFLGCTTSRVNNHFEISVNRKDTFSGLGMSFFSFCPFLFKINSVKTLLYRAYSICSIYHDLHNEFQFLIDYFCKNGYPKKSIENSINFLFEKYNSDKLTLPTTDIPKKQFYISFPFLGQQSIKIKSELENFYR